MADYKLRYIIDADGRQARKELEKVDRQLGILGKGEGLKALAGPATIAAAGLAAVTAAAVTATRAVFDMTREGAAYGSMISDITDKTGLGAKTITSLKYAADIGGSSIEAMTSGLGRFAKKVGEAADGSKTAAADIRALGIEPKEAFDDLDGALEKVFAQIMAAPPGVARTSLAMKAFGRTGADLIPVITTFNGDLGALKQRAEELGLTLTDETARAFDKFDDTLKQIDLQMQGVKNTIATSFLPVFQEMATATSDFLTRNQREVKSWSDSSADAFTAVARTVWDLVSAFSAASAEAAEFRAVQQAMSIWEWYQRNLDPLGARYWQYVDESRAARLNPTFRDPTPEQLAGMPEPSARWNRIAGMPSMDAAGGTPKLGPGGTAMKRFFEEELGAVVTSFRRSPGALTSGGRVSKHGFAEAVDIRTRDRSTDEIFTITARAIERGYRLVDERLKSGQPHQHYEANSLRASSFLGAEFYGGADRLAYLQSLDAQRLGKATGQQGFQSFLAAQAAEDERFLAHAQSVLDDWIRREQEASNRRLDIRQAEAGLVVQMIEQMVDQGVLTEAEGMKRLGELRVDMLKEEVLELKKQIPTAETLHRIEVLRLRIQEQELENTREITKLERRRDEERNASWKRHIANVMRLNDEESEARDQRARQEAEIEARRQLNTFGGGFMSTLHQGVGGVTTMNDVLQQMGNTAAGAFQQLGQGLGASLEAWVLLGSQAEISGQKLIASALGSVAAQSAAYSIFHTAMGIAALTPWGAAVYGPAPLHFKAAAMWAGIGAVTAVAGRAVAGNSFQRDAGGRASGAGAQGGRSDDPMPISRASDDAFISGRRGDPASTLARAVERLEAKIGSMSAGEVLVAGSRQRRGFISARVVADIKANASAGVRLGRSMGLV